MIAAGGKDILFMCKIMSSMGCGDVNIDGLVQERCNSIVKALGLRLSFTNPAMICLRFQRIPRFFCFYLFLHSFRIHAHVHSRSHFICKWQKHLFFNFHKEHVFLKSASCLFDFRRPVTS